MKIVIGLKNHISSISYLIININHGFTNILAALYLSKGFDILNHTIFLNKLCHLSISGNSHDWFLSYLSDRK